jgi:hypothetical protein
LEKELGLPVVEVNDRGEYRPLTMILGGGRVLHVVYPVGSPRAHIEGVLAWLNGVR